MWSYDPYKYFYGYVKLRCAYAAFSKDSLLNQAKYGKFLLFFMFFDV